MTTQERSRASRPRPSEELELRVTSLAHGGRGVARREDGYVVFVAGALPGDSVRAAVTKSKRSYAEARLVELLEPSPDRIPDRCLHGGEPCPGAPWQGLPYEQQLRHKSEQVEDALRRIGGLDGFELEPIELAVERWRYRNKLEYSFGERDGELALGFHARGRWDEVVDAEDCQLASAANNARRNEVREWAREAGVPAYDRRIRHGCAAQPRRPRGPPHRPAPDPPRHLAGRDPAPAGRPAHGRRGAGRRHRRPDRRARARVPGRALGDLEFRISHRAFFQTNTEMAERLYGAAAEMADLKGTERLFDLYCGIGTLALTMAARRGRGLGHRDRRPTRSRTPTRTPG